jgi:hypothetical protein
MGILEGTWQRPDFLMLRAHFDKSSGSTSGNLGQTFAQHAE